MQMIETVFYGFCLRVLFCFWKAPYFIIFRACLHDCRLLDLAVQAIILSWHYHIYYSHVFISQLLKLQDITAVPIINIKISIATNWS